MKKRCFLLVGLLFGIHVTSQCNLPSNLQTGLLASYTFGSSGLNDNSGNNHTLINTTTAHSTTDRNGNSNCAFEFDNLPASNNEFLTTTNTTFLNGLSQFSVSLWYEALDVSRDGASFEGLVSRGNVSSCPDRLGQWSLGMYDCRFPVFGRQNSVWYFDTGCVPEHTGFWRHFTATYNQIGQTIKIYIDGVLQGTQTGVGNCGIVPVTVMDSGDLFLGYNFTGKLDDIFIYNREITTTEVSQLYNLGSLCCSSVLANGNYKVDTTWKIFPNPVKNSLNIQSNENLRIYDIAIFNVLEQLVLDIHNPSTSLDVSSLISGTYFIEIISDKGTANTKFVKE